MGQDNCGRTVHLCVTMGTTRDLEALRSLAFAVESIRAEQGTRQEAAEQAAAEIDALAWNVGNFHSGSTPRVLAAATPAIHRS